jgi:hypothetical protein
MSVLVNAEPEKWNPGQRLIKGLIYTSSLILSIWGDDEQTDPKIDPEP